MERELREREERLNQGNHLFEWINSQVNAGKIKIDANGRPNIIGNEEDQDFDDDQVNWARLVFSLHIRVCKLWHWFASSSFYLRQLIIIHRDLTLIII